MFPTEPTSWLEMLNCGSAHTLFVMPMLPDFANCGLKELPHE